MSHEIYAEAEAAFNKWLSEQPEEIQELSLLEQIDAYAVAHASKEKPDD